MDTFEDILGKDIDDVVDWAYKIELVNVPKTAELALEALKDKQRHAIQRMHAMAVLLALPPHERGKYGPWSAASVAKIVAALYQIIEDPSERLDIREHVRKHLTRVLQRVPEFDAAFQQAQMEKHLHFCKDCGKAWRWDARECAAGGCNDERIRMCPWCVNDIAISGD